LSGEPGKTLVLARRSRNVWYIGGINGTDAPATFEGSASFLKDGIWTARSVGDGAADRGFMVGGVEHLEPSGTIRMPMRAHGGFVMRIERIATKEHR
jgi:hypothetical protein